VKELKRYEIAEREGYTRSYFASLNCSHPKKIDLMFGFDECAEKSIDMYKSYVFELLQNMGKIYYSFLSRIEVAKFLEITKTYLDISAFEKSIFRIVDNEISIPLSSIAKWEKIEKKYNELEKEIKLCSNAKSV
jgi:hypothetical protein